MKFFKYCSIFLGTFLLVGCASNNQDSLIVSKRIKNDAISKGIIYSLPKQLVKITYKKEFIDPKKTKAEIKKTKAKIESLTNSSNKKKTALSDTEALIKNINTKLPESDKLLAKYNLEIVKLSAEKSIFDLSIAKKNKELASLLSDFKKLDESKKVYKKTINIKPLEVEPDRHNSFTANLNHEITHSENLNIKLKKGMLSGSIGYSDDKTNDIIASLASSIFTATSGVSLAPKVKFVRHGIPECDNEPDGEVKVERIIDPLNSTELTSFSNVLLQKACLKIELKNSVVKIENRVVPTKNTDSTINGLVYQQPGVIEYIITDKSNSKKYTERVFLAQGGHTGFIPMTSGTFTKNEYSFSFSNGMLIESDTTRPSELYGALMIIPNTIKGIFALPTELIKLKVDYSTSEKDLAELEQSIMTALVEIKNKKIELDKKIDTNSTVD